MSAEELKQIMETADRRRRMWYLICLIESLKKLGITEVVEILDKHDAYFIDFMGGDNRELSHLKQEIIKLYYL